MVEPKEVLRAGGNGRKIVEVCMSGVSGKIQIE